MNCFPNIVFVELHLAYSHFTPIPDLRKKRFTATFVSYLIAILSLNMGADTFSTTDMILVGVICVCCSAALAVLVALICCRWRYSRRGHLPLPATAWEKLVLPSWSVALPLPPPVLRWESMFTLHSSFLHAIIIGVNTFSAYLLRFIYTIFFRFLSVISARLPLNWSKYV